MTEPIYNEEELVRAEQQVHDAYVGGVIDEEEVSKTATVLDVQEKAAEVASRIIPEEEPEIADVSSDVEMPEVPVATEEAATTPVVSSAPAEVTQEVVREVASEAKAETKIPNLELKLQ